MHPPHCIFQSLDSGSIHTDFFSLYVIIDTIKNLLNTILKLIRVPPKQIVLAYRLTKKSARTGNYLSKNSIKRALADTRTRKKIICHLFAAPMLSMIVNEALDLILLKIAVWYHECQVIVVSFYRCLYLFLIFEIDIKALIFVEYLLYLMISLLWFSLFNQSRQAKLWNHS